MSTLQTQPGASHSVPQRIEFTVNGKQVSASSDEQRSLLSVLREDFGFTSLKNGCEPQASCGCCLLMIDGKPRLSCTMKPQQAAGKTLTTMEGLSDDRRKQIADSFVSCGGVQCGFCIPGMAMRGHAIVEENPNPTRADINFELRGHLCRCTGYTKIVDAVEQYAAVRRGEQPTKQCDTSGRVGT